MKRNVFFITLILQLNISYHLLAQDKPINVVDSATFYYEKKDFSKAFNFYEAWSSTDNYNAYYAAVAACHAGNLERAKYYLKRSAEIGYDYLGYDKIANDPSNDCLHSLAEWKTFISNYKTSADSTLAALKAINNGLIDTSRRINKTTVYNVDNLRKFSVRSTPAQLISHLKNLNAYQSPRDKNFWTLYQIKVNDSLTVPFLLHIPKKYNPLQKTPLYVYLHGGIANKRNFSTPSGIPTSLEIKVMDNPVVENAFIIYPFGKKDFGWLYQQEAFQTIVRELVMVKSLYNIDDNRVYVGGHSNGGSGAFWFAINQPTSFAAFFGLNYFPKIYSSNTPLGNLKYNPPFFGVSGTTDQTFPLALVDEIYKTAAADGANWKRFTLAGGHTTTILNRDSIRYLFDDVSSKTRNPFPKNIEWQTDNVQNGRDMWVEITELDTALEKASWHKEINPALTQNGKTATVNFNKNKSGAIKVVTQGNTIDIKTSRVKRITLYISADMFDLDRPIKITLNGKEFINMKVAADKNVMLAEFLKTYDRSFIVANKIEIGIH